jgi:hypothetical protein
MVENINFSRQKRQRSGKNSRLVWWQALSGEFG